LASELRIEVAESRLKERLREKNKSMKKRFEIMEERLNARQFDINKEVQ